MNDYEREHNAILRRLGAECAVLLRADGSFPLAAPCEIALYGSGARRPDWLSDARTYPLLNASGKAISEFVDEQRAQKPAESDPAA